MSRATLTATFRDGTVLYGIYCGTTDVAFVWLLDSHDEAWRLSRSPEEPQNTLCGCDGEDVVLFTNYADGFYWCGKACREHRRVTKNLRPYNEYLGESPVSSPFMIVFRPDEQLASNE